MDEHEKLKKLYAEAEKDEIYRVWKKSRDYFTEAFQSFVNQQPLEVRNFLWGYAETGCMMLQRIVNIACEKMEFSDIGDKK